MVAGMVEDTTPPQAKPGFLAARTIDPGQISGEWAAVAGTCPEPPSLQILADGDSVGVLIVIAPDSGNPVTSYPIAVPDGHRPAPGTARMSVQRILYTGLAYAAGEGVVELSRFDRRVSGRLDVRLVDAITGRNMRYVGSFVNLRFAAWPAGFCALDPPPDSVAPDPIE